MSLLPAIMLLQSAYRFYGKEKLKASVVTEIAGVVPGDVIDWLFTSIKSNDLGKVEKCITEITLAGYSASQIVLQVCVGHEKRSYIPSEYRKNNIQTPRPRYLPSLRDPW